MKNEQGNQDLIPSAAVLLVRDVDREDKPQGEPAETIEVLLLQRNPSLAVDGGFWVFPGGKLEADELVLERLQAEKQAAIRECQEECGISLCEASVQPYSRWITPDIMPKRFNTAFFISSVDQNAMVSIDQSEIVDYRWDTPKNFLAQMTSNQLKVRAPALISMLELLSFSNQASLLQAISEREVEVYNPRSVKNSAEELVFIYGSDAGYQHSDSQNTDHLHRLVFSETGLQYFKDNKKWL